MAPRFAGRIRIDAQANAVFPHFDENGAICGFEKKNSGFTGFASGGTKALWLSQEKADDDRLILCEAAIDALSHAFLFSHPRARYASVGGKLNASQPNLIRAAIARMPSGGEIVAAMDNDDAGRRLVEVVARAFDEAKKDKHTFRNHEPVGFKDWNEQLQAAKGPRAVATDPSSAQLPSGTESFVLDKADRRLLGGSKPAASVPDVA